MNDKTIYQLKLFWSGTVGRIRERELFSLFDLMERERAIVLMHTKGFTFEVIAGIQKVSIARVQQIHKRALKKMGRQLLQILKEKSAQNIFIKSTADVFIGGNGVPWYGGERNAHRPSLLTTGYLVS